MAPNSDDSNGSPLEVGDRLLFGGPFRGHVAMSLDPWQYKQYDTPCSLEGCAKFPPHRWVVADDTPENKS